MTTQKNYRMTDVTLAQLEDIRATLEEEQGIRVNATETIAYCVQNVFWEMRKHYYSLDENARGGYSQF